LKIYPFRSVRDKPSIAPAHPKILHTPPFFSNIKEDSGESNNLINAPAYTDVLKSLKKQLNRLLRQTHALPDKMPLDPGVKTELPEESIR